MKPLNLLRWLVIFSLLLPALAVSASPPAPGTPSGERTASARSNTAADWLHFGYDSSYTAHNTIESTLSITNVSKLERKWGIGCDDGYFSVISRSPAVYNGKLYTSGAGSKLTAYNARTGQKLWQFGSGNLGWAPQPVASEDGLVFYMEGSSGLYNLYAVNADSGSKVWEAPLAFNMSFNDTALVTVDEAKGLVYLVETPFIEDGKLYALNKQTGEIAWSKSKPIDGVAFKGDYVLLNGGRLFALADAPMSGYPDHGDHMLKIDTTSHAIETTFNRPKPEGYYAIKQYTLCNDRLVVNFDYQYDPVKLLVAYDPISPTIAWQKPFSETTGTIACNKDKNLIYVPTDPYLYALDATTGAEVWKYTGYGAIYNPSIANDIVYFLSDTNMYAINEDTRERLFRYPLGYESYETTQVAIAGGMLYFSGNGGTCDLFALGLPGPKVFLPLVVKP